MGQKASSARANLAGAHERLAARRAQRGARAVAQRLAPNVLSVQHWHRLEQGLLYAATPRVDWPTLLRRTFDIDVLQCPRCQGRLRILAVITDELVVARILPALGLATDAPAIARARDPTDLLDFEQSDATSLA